MVNVAEITAHQNPSGLDAKTCLSEKPIKFIKNKGFSYIDINLGAYLVIADSGIYGNTKEAVEKVRKLGKIAKEPLKKLGELTEKFESLIKNKFSGEKIKKIGQIMISANDELKKIGVTISKTEMFVKKAIENGASGAKISGGGLGGCIIALCKSQKIAKKCWLKMEQSIFGLKKFKNKLKKIEMEKNWDGKGEVVRKYSDYKILGEKR